MTPAQQAERRSRDALVRELEAAGAVFKGNECRCPFHEDHRASAGIYEDRSGTWRFRCQSQTCGVSGDLFDIRAKIQGRSLADVLRGIGPDQWPIACQRASEACSRPNVGEVEPGAGPSHDLQDT